VSAPSELLAQQFALSAHLRDPQHVAAPEGIEDRRLAIYRELVFANLDSLLGGGFPVARRMLGTDRWQALVRDFLRDHRSPTPLFPELPREFARYLAVRAEADFGDPPWLPELAHYEWIEVALDYAEAEALPPVPAGFDPQTARLQVSPLAWPQAYAWPVHRLGPGFAPDEVPEVPTCLLLQRDAAGAVRFHEIGAVAFRVLEHIGEHEHDTGAQHVEALVCEAGGDDAFRTQAIALLRELVGAGVIGAHVD
jgi:hypothetical protein